MKKNIFIIIVVLLVLIIGFFAFRERAFAPSNGVVEDGREISYTNASRDMIVVDTPSVGAMISSPLSVRGEARGGWYFEATFPFVLVDWDGLIIAEGFATAQDDWMTEDFVPFAGTLTFTQPDTGVSNKGTLIIHNANASGLSEHDRAVEIPVTFNSN